MSRKCNAFLTVILLVSFFFKDANAQLTISGEVRPRAELRHGVKSLASKNQDAAFFIDQRTRLNLNFASADYTVYISLHDIRTWGNQSQLVTGDGALTGIHQAWAKINIKPKLAIKLGRQEINYDDQRIFGSVGWAQQARSHDAALLKFKSNKFKADLGLAFNQNGPQLSTTIYTVNNNYKTIQYLYLQQIWENLTGSFLFLNNGVQVFPAADPKTHFTQTAGFRLAWKKEKIAANVAAYYQGGTNSDTLATKVNAYYAGGDIGYAVLENFKLKAGFELLSGNDRLSVNNKNNAFTPFYGTNHKFNGLMDYFYVGNHVGNVGLNDFFINASVSGKSINASLAGHVFFSNGAMNGLPDMSKYLGSEIDFTLSAPLTKSAKLQLGYSQLFGSEKMEVLKGGDMDAVSNWAWVMVTVKPSYTFKKE